MTDAGALLPAAASKPPGLPARLKGPCSKEMDGNESRNVTRQWPQPRAQAQPPGAPCVFT